MIEIYKEFITRDDITSRQKMILMQMLRYKIDNIHFNQSLLSKVVGVNISTMTKDVNALVTKNFVRIEKDYTVTNLGVPIYRINIPISPQLSEHIVVQKEYPVAEIMEHLSLTTGESYVATDSIKQLIADRFKEGHTIDDFKKVIDICYQTWNGTKFEIYINPKHLFDEGFAGRLSI